MARIAVKQRLDYIDDAKALAILLMIIGHMATYKTVDVLIYGFHIPLFFRTGLHIVVYYCKIISVMGVIFDSLLIL